jgi:hypothetical protein
MKASLIGLGLLLAIILSSEPNLVHPDVQELCPLSGVALIGAPRGCVLQAQQRSLAQMQRTLKQLQQTLEMLRPVNMSPVPTRPQQ